jgi:serine/threonine protein phosphatase PrpC
MLLKRKAKPSFAQTQLLSLHGTMLTHPGCLREINEDVVAYTLQKDAGRVGSSGALAVLADGMGGHAAGEVASGIAADTILRRYYELEGEPPKVLAGCFAEANQAIYERGRSDPVCAGMGTTCTVLAIKDNAFYLGHIGDSRAYLLRDGNLQQISEDHSLVAQMMRDGAITADEAALSPQRGVILRALGMQPTAEPSISRKGFPLRAGDIFVLCSDGLSDVVADSAISEAVIRLTPFQACRALIDQALAAGGPDNISVGVIAVEHCTPAPAPCTTRPVDVPGDAP